MKAIFEKIWELSLPYQDKRDDEGHTKITTDYALKLLETEKGDDNVVVPAIILHDIGWSQLNKDERMIALDHSATKDQKLEVRYKHQDAGVKLGKEILDQLNYPEDLIDEILEIISQHDTREGFISQNEGLVRDADKLWRFSKTGFTSYFSRNKFSLQQVYDKFIKKIELPNFFYSDKAKQIAYDELKMRKQDCNGAKK